MFLACFDGFAEKFESWPTEWNLRRRTLPGQENTTKPESMSWKPIWTVCNADWRMWRGIGMSLDPEITKCNTRYDTPSFVFFFSGCFQINSCLTTLKLLPQTSKLCPPTLFLSHYALQLDQSAHALRQLDAAAAHIRDLESRLSSTQNAQRAAESELIAERGRRSNVSTVAELKKGLEALQKDVARLRGVAEKHKSAAQGAAAAQGEAAAARRQLEVRIYFLYIVFLLYIVSYNLGKYFCW